MVEEDILKKIRRVKLDPENNRRVRFLSKEESHELINACLPHLRPVVVTALNTGMRKEEILSLRWDDNIDMRHGFIRLLDTKNNERRDLPMNAAVKEVFGKIVRRVDVPWVFYDSKTGKRYGDMKRSFYSACRRAGIKDFRFHDLRPQLVMAGVDITTVKDLMGHKTLSMTLRYAHLAASHKENAVDRLCFTPPENSTSRLVHVS